MQSYGFIGLGAMGRPMADNLVQCLSSKEQLYVFDVEKSVLDDFAQTHTSKATVCSSPGEVAVHADTIITMLPEGSHVKSVYVDNSSDGSENTSLSSQDLNNKLLIDCSTIDTTTSLFVKSQLARKFPQCAFYDAPVSGGVLGAEKGTIAFFLGCTADDPNMPRLTGILSTMGNPDSIIPCGGPSLGLASKFSNNYLSGLITIACSEAFDMGMRAGIDPRTLYKVFGAGTAQNTICDKFCPVPGVVLDAPSSKGYKGGFKVQLMKKDLTLATEMARKVGAKNHLGKIGLQTYEGASEECTDLDSRVIFRYLGGNEKWQED